jgi:hypothetical protein
MTAQTILNNVVRFFLLAALQVIVFNQISWGWGGRALLFVFVYPLFVALLPLRMPRPAVILVAFLLGFAIDIFSETLGLHAGALTFTAYCRPFILSLLQPRDGYPIKANPVRSDLGTAWLVGYLAGMLCVHLLAFFLLQTFSLYFAGEILTKTLLTLPASLVFMVTAMLIIDPKS